MGQTLVLNASYEPLNITSWRRAVILMIKGKAESLEEDKSYSIHCGENCHSYKTSLLRKVLLRGFFNKKKYSSKR